jgi:hypothetical protein
MLVEKVDFQATCPLKIFAGGLLFNPFLVGMISLRDKRTQRKAHINAHLFAQCLIVQMYSYSKVKNLNRLKSYSTDN